jgi:hypothetical protein
MLQLSLLKQTIPNSAVQCEIWGLWRKRNSGNVHDSNSPKDSILNAKHTISLTLHFRKSAVARMDPSQSILSGMLALFGQSLRS